MKEKKKRNISKSKVQSLVLSTRPIKNYIFEKLKPKFNFYSASLSPHLPYGTVFCTVFSANKIVFFTKQSFVTKYNYFARYIFFAKYIYIFWQNTISAKYNFFAKYNYFAKYNFYKIHCLGKIQLLEQLIEHFFQLKDNFF